MISTRFRLPSLFSSIALSAAPFLLLIAGQYLADANFFTALYLDIGPHISQRLPELLKPLPQFVNFLAFVFAFIIVFTFTPAQFKKPLIAVASIAFLLQRMSTIGAFVGILTAIALYFVFRFPKRHFRIVSYFVLMGGLSYFFVVLRDSTNGVWRLYAQLFVGIIGLEYFISEADSSKPKVLNPLDAFIYLCGFHGVFLTVIYGYQALTGSYMRLSHAETAAKAPGLISAGLFKLLAVTGIQVLMFPIWNYADSSISTIGIANPDLSLLQLSGLTIILLYAFLIEHVGFIQIFQGVSRLFGYDVKEHALSPWLSTSFLDYWRRTGTNTRDYMLTHILMPTYRKTKSLYLSVVAVWTVWAFTSFLTRGGLAGDDGFSRLPTTILVWLILLKFSILYAHVCYAEMRWIQPLKLAAIKKGSRRRRVFVFALAFSTFFVTLVLGNEILPTISSGIDAMLDFVKARSSQ